MATIRETINKVIDTRNGLAAGKIVEFLRFGGLKMKDGTPVTFTYDDCVEFFQRGRPNFTRDDFEDLMVVAEEAESHGT
jgi:hypothetical protein